MQVANGFAGAIDLLLDRILEVPRETLDLLRLLLEVTPETRQLTDNLHFHLDSLIRLGVPLTVKVAKNLCGIGEASRLQEGGGEGLVVDDIGGGQE